MAFFKFLKNYTIFIGKRLRWSLFLIKLQASRLTNLLKRDSNTAFSCEITLFYLLILFYLSLAIICCHSWSCFFNRCHSLSLFIHCHLLYHKMSLVIICCTTRCHSLSFTRCHSLSLAVPHDVTRGQSLSIIVTRYITSLFFNKISPSRDIT